jgi:hypothetical protein
MELQNIKKVSWVIAFTAFLLTNVFAKSFRGTSGVTTNLTICVLGVSGSLQACAAGVEAAVQERARSLHRRSFDGPICGRSYLADHLCLHLLVAVEQNLRRHRAPGDWAPTLFRAFAILVTK